MQNNVPIYTAKMIKKSFYENSVTIIDWPPHYPDLNPIECLLYKLKQLVYQVNSDIYSVTSSNDKVRGVL